MEITTELIKSLRDRTGLSVMQCKKALEEANGDIDQAEVIMRKRSASAAEKKEGRDLAAGTIGSYVHEGVIGSMVLLSSETDFVSQNPEFVALARDLAMHIAASNPKYITDAEISEDAKNAAIAVFEKELEGKPEDMKEKIMAGKLAAYFQTDVLMNQQYIKDDTKTIQQLLNEAGQKFGERIAVSKFARFSAR